MPSEHYREITDKLLQLVGESVDLSVSVGLPDHLHRLGDPSLEARDRELEKVRQLIASIDTSQGEGFYERLDLELTRLYLEQWLFADTLQLNGQPLRRQKPAGVDGVSEGIFQLFVNDERAPAARLDDILSRLRMVPEYLERELAVLTTPVRRWRDIELNQAGEIPELFETVLNWARESGFTRIDELEDATQSAVAALQDYSQRLAQLPTTDAFSIGREQMEDLLAIKRLGKTPEQLRQMAADYMGGLQSSLQELRERLVAKYALDPATSLEQLHEFLNQRFAVQIEDGQLASVLDHYMLEKEKIFRWNQERNLFPVPEAQDMVIMQTPGFLEPVIPAGAMWPPLALREGVRKSMVHLTLKADELAEHTHLGIPMMMVHEGIPGHHLQFACASLQDSVIRRLFSANDHAEGWTTMLEDYMLDNGYVDDAIIDEVRFVTKRDIARLVARVGIDLYFMSGDSHFLDVGLDLEFTSQAPFENAAKLLKAATGFTDGRVQSELNWYSKEHGYPLSYLTGNRLVWELKNDIIEANRRELEAADLDREFHRVYLQSGCMPVTVLREVYRHEGLL
ncbi:DUF885 family protein [Haliea sp. E17]|uniref:DUF885 family protein n=1 Tax=Haliea sp. E17 TaxID=3401576 RepID=UPI003AADE7D1